MKMKKALASTLFVALAAAPLAAQTTIGLKGGIGTATLSGEARQLEAETEPRFGVASGLEMGIPLPGFLDVRIGMGLAQKGGSIDVPPTIGPGRSFFEAMAELDYLQFSTLLRASTDTSRGRLNIGVLAGPYMAFNLSCGLDVRGSERSFGGFTSLVRPPRGTGTSCTEAEGADFRSTDFGLAVGAGVEAGLNDSLRLAIDLIYASGLSAVDDDGTRNRHLALQGGILLAIGGQGQSRPKAPPVRRP